MKILPHELKNCKAKALSSSAARAFSATGPAAEDDLFRKLRSGGSCSPPPAANRPVAEGETLKVEGFYDHSLQKYF